MHLYSTYKPPKPSYNLLIVTATLVIAPLSLQPLAGQTFAVILMIPTLFLLDSNLKEYAQSQTFYFSKIGRNATNALKSLSLCFFIILLSAIILSNVTIIGTITVLISYLAITVFYTYRHIPLNILKESKTWSRTLVGDTETKLINIKVNTRIPVRIFLLPVDSWVKLTPNNITPSSQTETSLQFTPPLAGPSKISVQASIVDPRGIIVTNQLLHPIDLHVIPKAEYAKWLANKFLEQTSHGEGTATGIARLAQASKSGVEFRNTRPYQPGDSWRNFDWKHTYMLGQLIVKEFSEAQGNVGIIIADLTAKNAKEADKLAYNLVMSALTLAKEALPAAIAVYNSHEVIAVTPPTSPRETLKKTLEITEKIIIEEPKEKVLQPLEIGRLKRSISQLEINKTESAQKLKEILNFEAYANQQSAKEHPAMIALMKTVKLTEAPSVVTVASPIGYDSDALLLGLEQLRRKGFRIVFLDRPGI
jgi:uncharacterized protein (DUF58 family)